MPPQSVSPLPYVWDYDLTEAQFTALLNGKLTLGRLDQAWAAGRRLDYAPYDEIIRRLGFARLVKNWPRWRARVRSESRRHGFDFLAAWLPVKHPELCRE